MTKLKMPDLRAKTRKELQKEVRARTPGGPGVSKICKILNCVASTAETARYDANARCRSKIEKADILDDSSRRS